MKNKVKIEYSIISRGTEKYNHCGYMSITENVDNYRYIVNCDHNELESTIKENSLKFDDKHSISNVVISRFELIVSLCLEKCTIDDDIIIFGLGNLGFATLLYLLKKGYKRITVFSNKKENVKDLERKFDAKITIVNKLSKDYCTYIDCTGSSEILKLIFEKIGFMKKIFILSTPRDSKFLIDPLLINRKNLLIVGGHEFNGISNEIRNNKFSKILLENKGYCDLFSNYISIHSFSLNKYKDLLNKKSNYYDVFKY